MRRLRNLLDGLPVDARCRQDDPDEPRWSFTEELLAQVVEEVSVLAADRRRKEPRQLPRPRSVTAAAKASQPARKHGGLLEAAMSRGAVTSSG